jgi:SAM-dependent methyltransferase
MFSSMSAWTWDETLFAGAARYYAVGRAAYPPELAEKLVAALHLDGTGLLVDVGCGPGSIALQLAPHYAEVIGVDADAEMVAVAGRLAAEQGVPNASWRHLRGEQLPAGISGVRTVVFAQSFHWMDRPLVAGIARGMLAPDGALVHVHATTHRGEDGVAGGPPYEAITALIQRYLGPDRRAGQSVLPAETVGGDEDTIYRGAGFAGRERIELPSRVVERSADEIAASIFSLSSSAPHLFGDQFDKFDGELRQLLNDAGQGRPFTERMRSIAIDIWR